MARRPAKKTKGQRTDHQGVTHTTNLCVKLLRRLWFRIYSIYIHEFLCHKSNPMLLFLPNISSAPVGQIGEPKRKQAIQRTCFARAFFACELAGVCSLMIATDRPSLRVAIFLSWLGKKERPVRRCLLNNRTTTKARTVTVVRSRHQSTRVVLEESSAARTELNNNNNLLPIHNIRQCNVIWNKTRTVTTNIMIIRMN